jgi:hypothetical protein
MKTNDTNDTNLIVRAGIVLYNLDKHQEKLSNKLVFSSEYWNRPRDNQDHPARMKVPKFKEENHE